MQNGTDWIEGTIQDLITFSRLNSLPAFGSVLEDAVVALEKDKAARAFRRQQRTIAGDVEYI